MRHLVLVGILLVAGSLSVACGGGPTGPSMTTPATPDAPIVVNVVWGPGVNVPELMLALDDLERDTAGLVRTVRGTRGERTIDVRFDPSDPWFRTCDCGAFAQPFNAPFAGTRGVGAGPIVIAGEHNNTRPGILHELGHLFGLVHDSGVEDVMSPYLVSTRFSAIEQERLRAGILADDDAAARF